MRPLRPAGLPLLGLAVAAGLVAGCQSFTPHSSAATPVGGPVELSPEPAVPNDPPAPVDPPSPVDPPAPAGGLPAPAPETGASDPSAERPWLAHRDSVRGIYLTGYTAGDSKRREALLAYSRKHGINAWVIDVKDDDGLLTFAAALPAAEAIGALARKIADLPALIRELHGEGLYLIGRVVVFADPVASRAHPDWAIHQDGRIWRDGRGISWTHPANPEVRRYNTAIAKAAADAGFDEIQFDYVRFPEARLPGVTGDVPREERVAAVQGFLEEAAAALRPLGVAVSADVFGLTTTVVDDMRIGQEYGRIAAALDYISPMVYPSHYNPGLFGLDDPNRHPYETVLHSLRNGIAKAPGLGPERHRPWLQDFSLGHRYGIAEVEAQIRAVSDAGLRSFLLWNPNNRYTEGVDTHWVDSPAPFIVPDNSPKPVEEPVEETSVSPPFPASPVPFEAGYPPHETEG